MPLSVPPSVHRRAMPLRPPRRCSRCGKPTVGRCQRCLAISRQRSDTRRGDATQRGYGGEHRTRFRPAVLAKDPACVLCHQQPSTVADHWPQSRRELEAAGEDPNDPRHGRGLCHPCHSKATAANPTQRGGWNRR